MHWSAGYCNNLLTPHKDNPYFRDKKKVMRAEEEIAISIVDEG